MTKAVTTRRGNPAPSALIQDLQRLGFSEYEARTYVSLLHCSPATAYEVSKNSGLPRANTYGALESLANKEAVQPISENPVRYAPVEPEILLTRLSRQVNALCERLRTDLGNISVDAHSDVVWTISGQTELTEKINELIGEAQHQIWIKASSEVMRTHFRQVKQAVGKGVELLLILFGSNADEFRFNRKCRVYLHEGSGVRLGGADNLFTIAIDGRVALTANVSGEVIGAYTSSEPVVRMAETLIRHDYYMAEILSHFGAAIEERFGKYLVELRRQTFSSDQFQHLEQNLARVRDDCPPATEPGRSVRAGLHSRSGTKRSTE